MTSVAAKSLHIMHARGTKSLRGVDDQGFDAPKYRGE